MPQTLPKPKKPYKPMRSKKWCLTLHGATDEQEKKLKELFSEEDIPFALYSLESGEHSVHPHFQVYFETSQATRMMQRCRDLFLDNFHLEVARGTRATNVAYVYGMQKPYEIGWVKYTKGDVLVPRGYNDFAVKFMESFKPRPFQKWLLDLVSVPADNRTIVWLWEPTGCTGKTTIAQYMHRMYGAILVGGKSDNMKYALVRFRELVKMDPKIVIVDIPRSVYRISGTTINGIEELKNGLFFAGKYESGMVDSSSPTHMIVISNHVPPVNKFSKDRWKIVKIDNETWEPIFQQPEEFLVEDKED